MEEEQEHDGAGDPAQAFEALRAEVAVLRHAIEAAAERQAPDYSPDLGRITQAVNGVIDGLEAIEAHPAVRMTPDQFGQAMCKQRWQSVPLHRLICVLYSGAKVYRSC